ncbi:MAG TPA: hypothetical protein VF136_06520 [Methylomirabilota bacterium]
MACIRTEIGVEASVQVFADGPAHSRLLWVADLLPDELAGDIRAMMEQAAAVMKPTLEGRPREAQACSTPS